MRGCQHCNATVLFGGYRDGDRRYCNESCFQQAVALVDFAAVPDELVLERARELRAGDCPRCKARGPVEVHISHRVVSALVVTSWKSTPHVLCRSCGRVKQIQDLLISTLFGWWGVPWGLFMTPVYVVRGLLAVTRGDAEEDAEPSAELLAAVRYQLAVVRDPQDEANAFEQAA